MSARAVNRPVESRAVADFLGAARCEPAGLVLEGDAGIGKTTLWLDALDQAREGGFRVLSARGAAAESILAYAGVADLLDEVDPSEWVGLPRPQRLAMDRVVLRADGDDTATDQRAVAAGFLSVIEGQADASPVLLAIDDLQWLDSSSVRVFGFAARRLSARVGVLGTVRTEPGGRTAASWLQLRRPDAIGRIRVCPLSPDDLHAVVSERLDRSFSKSTMMRIGEISGGNPFYALELARAIEGQALGVDAPLPGSLAELVRARIAGLGTDGRDVLLAVASTGAPTMELVARATDTDTERVLALLEDPEDKGVVAIDGPRLRFTHPLLAHGIYSDTTSARRQIMHRRLAAVIEEPELRARHLALAATGADPQTLQSLDQAAEIAHGRGAPAAAAELLDLAIGLGGDTPERRVRSARHRFNAGDFGPARAMLADTIQRLRPGTLRAEALNMLAHMELISGSMAEAAGLLEQALGEAVDHLALRVHISITLSYAQFHCGHPAAALRTIEDSVTTAERLGVSQLLSQALGMRSIFRFLAGDGRDEDSLRRALELEDHQAAAPFSFRPSVQCVMLTGWAGQLEHVRDEMLAIRRDCIERGEESDLLPVAFQQVWIAIWRGDFAEATAIADDAMQRAVQLGGDLSLAVALMFRAAAGAYTGREHEARRDATDSIAACQRVGWPWMAGFAISSLGFLDVSLGDYDSALRTLEPLVATLETQPNGTELIAAPFLPDALEAMVNLGRFGQAEPLIDLLERNGRRLDRPWMLAVGARSRALLLGARGELDAASAAVQQALDEHRRLPMPFARARTQLLHCHLEHRQGHRDAASAALGEALGTFERLNTPLWADRARTMLARTAFRPATTALLTASEQHVAELAASGMSNRDVAAALFISVKTVEAALTRTYRKLGIRSRVSLARRMDRDQSLRNDSR